MRPDGRCDRWRGNDEECAGCPIRRRGRRGPRRDRRVQRLASGGGRADPPPARRVPSLGPTDPLATYRPAAGDGPPRRCGRTCAGWPNEQVHRCGDWWCGVGQVLARFAAGEADEAKHIPIRPDTIFRLASVSKQFTAMLVLKLRDRGRLRLDDKICPYLVPKFVKACPKRGSP